MWTATPEKSLSWEFLSVLFIHHLDIFLKQLYIKMNMAVSIRIYENIPCLFPKMFFSERVWNTEKSKESSGSVTHGTWCYLPSLILASQTREGMWVYTAVSRQFAQGLVKPSSFFLAILTTQLEKDGTENRESECIWMSTTNILLNFLQVFWAV